MRLLKDPLVLFLSIGALLLVFASWLQGDDQRQINITNADIARLNDQWKSQMGRDATETELDALLEQFLREEVYYREAMQWGLDKNDTIVRRRLVQKLTFLTEDLATLNPPTEAEIETFYAENQNRYQLPERLTFRHRYFSADRREDARADAEAALADETIAGDSFLLQKSYAARSEREIADHFGSAFAETVFKQPAQQWSGPLRSAYGWHVVYIEERLETRTQSLAEVRDRVLNDMQLDLRKQANDQFYEQLRKNYEIVLP